MEGPIKESENEIPQQRKWAAKKEKEAAYKALIEKLDIELEDMLNVIFCKLQNTWKTNYEP